MSELIDTQPDARLADVQVGPISRSMLALYAGASGDHNRIHIDQDFALAAGLPDVIAQGMLPFGVLAQVVTRWAGIQRLRGISARFVSMTRVHDVITCSGTVIERFEADGETRVRALESVLCAEHASLPCTTF